MAKVVALANQKGGVGKTTTAVNLGAYLAGRGRRVLLLDVDPQGNATGSLGHDKRHLACSVYDVLVGKTRLATTILLTHMLRLDLVPAAPALAAVEVELVSLEAREGVLARALEDVKPLYDVVLVDCPPSLGLLTINALVAADAVLVPVQCEYLALEGLVQLMDTVRMVTDRVNPRLRLAGLVMTMYDARTNLSPQVVQEVRAHFPALTYDTIIPRSVRLSEAPSYGQTILQYDPASRGGRAYEAFAAEFSHREGLTA